MTRRERRRKWFGNDLCRLIRGTWWPKYYRGQDGRMKSFHPFRRAAPCVIGPIVRVPLAQIRHRQMKERIERVGGPRRGYFPGAGKLMNYTPVPYED